MNNSNIHGQNSLAGEPLKPRTVRRGLRRWQKEAKRIYADARQKEFLLTATPGSGKSAAAAEITRLLMEQGKIDRIVVVAPTEHLKYQWARSFHDVGIRLDPTWSNASRIESTDAHGIVVTYAQVSADPAIYDFHCRRGRTLVIFDEIHHAGDSLDWGVKLRQAFESAALILGLSGTLFRHDKNPIPFVKYDDNGKSIANYSYSYGDALKDNVCRPVVFPTFEGSASWYDGRGIWKSQSEFNGLSRKEAAELLRVLLEPAGNWLRTVLREANDKLTEFRLTGHPDAAGLVIARDQKHARKIAALLEKLTGENVTIVISEDPESDKFLHDFKADGNTSRWIVAVKMVSEGIDIPRLRVGVYATTTLTELAFRQAVGRFVRMLPELGEQHAAFYMPAHPAMVRYAVAIKEERDHVIAHYNAPNTSFLNSGTADAYGQQGNGCASAGDDVNNHSHNGSDGGEFAIFGENETPVFNESSSGSPHNMGLPPSHTYPNRAPISSQIFIQVKSEARYEKTIFDGKFFSEDELNLAEQHARNCGLNAPPEQLAAFLRMANGETGDLHGGKSDRMQNNISRNASEANPNSSNDRSPSFADSSRAFSNVGQPPSAPLEEPTLMLHEHKKVLRDAINKSEARLAGLTGKKPGNFHAVWTRELGQIPQGIASVTELEKKLAWLNEQLDQVESGKVVNPRLRR